jgi:hypothetical protein
MIIAGIGMKFFEDKITANVKTPNRSGDYIISDAFVLKSTLS